MARETTSRYENLESLVTWLAQRYGKDVLNAVANWTRRRNQAEESSAAQPQNSNAHSAHAESPISRLTELEVAHQELARHVAELEAEAGSRIGGLDERLSSELRRMDMALNQVIALAETAAQRIRRMAWAVAALLVVAGVETVYLFMRH